MQNVIGVVFNTNRIYYFDPDNKEYKKGDKVIVETEKGLQFGTIDTDVITLKSEQIKGDLKKIIRLADQKDVQKNEKNINDAKKALENCKEIAKKLKLDMNVIDAGFTFDRNQLIFHFISSDRVDFRELAKELANIYKTRIELRQVGIRDKAKEIGGIGICGRTICCHAFLDEFDSITISMAKNQNLSLNPSKINGLCGRLLCCLKYEDENYRECHKGLPKIGEKIKVKKSEGPVVSIDVLNRTYKVDVPNEGIVEVKADESIK